MKRFFKYLSLILLISLISTCFIFRHRISLYISVTKKIINSRDNLMNFNGSLNNTISDEYVEKNIIYKDTNNFPLTLDLYKPTKTLKSKSPVLIYVHGGSWSYGNKDIPEILSPVLNIFRDEGYSIISISYELMKESVNFDKQISDVKDAVRWVNKNKDIYNFDINEIGLVGISSGAHLALMASYTDNTEFIDDNMLSFYPSNVKYVVDFSGPTDLSTIDISNANDTIKDFLSHNSNKQNIINKYSPVNYIDNNDPKTLIIHSKNDNIVPYNNGLTLYERSKTLGNNTKLITLEHSGHDLSGSSNKDITNIALSILLFILNNSPL